MSSEEVANLKAMAFRGRRAKTLKASETYRDIYKALADRQQRVQDQMVAAPMKATETGALAMLVTRLAGQNAEIEETVKMFQRWIDDGQEAEKKLEEMKIPL